MNGVLVVDKPRGPTSFDVVARVRQATGIRRVGHTGTLDPMASGVLPVCVGEATKLVPFLMAGEKEYLAEARLGITTDTLDAEGQVCLERDPSSVTREALEEALAAFRGAVRQVPPMHSALRVGGKRLYELAREGKEIEREAREIEIHELRLEAFDPPQLRFTVRCGKGTYVRSLAADLGERLGVGAHLTALRRTRVGPFTLADAVALASLGQGAIALVPLADALAHLPSVTVDAALARALRDGQPQAVAALAVPKSDAPFVRILRGDGSLLAVCTRSAGPLRLERVFC